MPPGNLRQRGRARWRVRVAVHPLELALEYRRLELVGQCQLARHHLHQKPDGPGH